MKDLPLLFTTEMMRANLANIKTQTRRLRSLNQVNVEPNRWHLWQPRVSEESGEWAFSTNPLQGEKGEIVHVKCPYGIGMPARKMWAREGMYEDDDGFWRYRADDAVVGCDRADEAAMIVWAHHTDRSYCPNIHMPRWACRFERTIIRIRCERLHSITQEDAIAEGVAPLFTPEEAKARPELNIKPMPWNNYLWHGYVGKTITQAQADAWPYQFSSYEDPRLSYSSLWERINGIGSWDRNPYVWVIEYAREAANA